MRLLFFARAIQERLRGLRKHLFVVLTLLIVCGAIFLSGIATQPVLRLHQPGKPLLRRGARDDALKTYSEALKRVPGIPRSAGPSKTD